MIKNSLPTHKRIHTTACILAALGLSQFSANISNAQTFLEQNGLVVIEAESTALPSGWVKRTAADIPAGDPNKMSGFTGDGWIEWTGAQQYGNQIPVSQANGIITYTFEITNPGLYSFRWRSKQKDAGQTFDAGNDNWVRWATGSMPSGAAHDFGIFTKIFIQWKTTWDPPVNEPNGKRPFDTRAEPAHSVFVTNQFTRQLDAGTHSIQFAARSPGHSIDRFVIHRNDIASNSYALFRDTPESPRQSTGGGSEPLHVESVMRDADRTVTEGNTAINSSTLDISPTDTAHLKFNQTGLTLNNSNLVLRVTEAGSGTIRVHEFSGVNGGWLESNLAQTTPIKGTQLGSVSGTFTAGQDILIPIATPAMTWTSLIVSMDSGGDGISVSSIEGANTPNIRYGTGSTLGSYRDAHVSTAPIVDIRNNTELTVAPNSTAYMKFDVNEVTSAVPTKLVLQVTQSGNGTLRVNQGDGGSSWTESDLDTVTPSRGTELGSVSGSFVAGETVEIDLGFFVPPSRWFSLVLSMDNGGSTTAFSAQEGADGPTLEFGPEPVAAETKDPARDAYTVNSGTTPAVDSTTLRVSPNDTTYMKFTPVAAGITTSAGKLKLNVTSGGSGTLRVHQGVGSEGWLESTLTGANAPIKGAELGSISGSFANGSTIEIPLQSIPSGWFTLVVSMDGGGSDVTVSSDTGSIKPQLDIYSE
ncbi:hypothetical protein [Coraliomargarita akajimensis]|uniref:Uncharacterized protein n=1 Tax=Coraliomargarita akajimensis (strain DSM 45221 / IAM 15411 / JCM 23193 / KCTC 12865 / 04OKA010-24) TaxID=583355 RepID=D5EII8_CORAD|nr:hypothetical protein [Coraliomargarita akajimensis]ADE54254.1 hypothetical protein Caka_1234 [Coraliomargarita akajimensis DSM 45221]